MNGNTKPKRARLSKKQRWFLLNLFDAGLSIDDSLQRLGIRRRTLRRWLSHPVFVKELEMYMDQFHLEARMEIARGVPAAVLSLQTFCSKSMDREFVRKACADILKIQHEYEKTDSGFKVDDKAAKTEFFGAFLEQFRAVLDNNGAVSEQFGISKITHQLTQKPPSRLKNPENIQFPRLLAAKNEVSTLDTPAGGRTHGE